MNELLYAFAVELCGQIYIYIFINGDIQYPFIKKYPCSQGLSALYSLHSSTDVIWLMCGLFFS